MIEKVCRRRLAMVGMALLVGGCVRTRVIEELRRDERLHRQQALLREQIAELEARNEDLSYAVEYGLRRQDAGRREADWWKDYGREELGRCVAAVNQLITRVDGRLQGLYASYYGAACRPRSDIERSAAILIADLEHALDGPVEITAGMTYIAEASQFSFVILRPHPAAAGQNLYRTVWSTPLISTLGGEEQRWYFSETFKGRRGDVPAIFFPNPAGVYMDRLQQVDGKGLGSLAVVGQRAAPADGTLLELPDLLNDRQYSFALMGVPIEE